MPKPDEAHLRTEKELQALERRIAQVYKEAADELTDTLKDYFESFRKRDEDMRKRVESGEITEDYYKQWRLNQIGRGKRFEALRDQVAERYTKANETAIAYVNDQTPGIYSLNRNYAAYTIEQVAGDVGFTLWDESTVRRLIVEQPDVMPYYPPPRAVKRGIDLAYGKSQITKSVTSSILQGKSIGKMADDLQRRITDMSRVSAIRAARTSTTAAENAGRMDSYQAAEKMGIKMRKEWLATLDGRTRHAHAVLDGQKADVDKPFKVDGREIRFPGDPQAAADLVYNCFVGKTKIASDSKIIRSYKHKYAGDLIEIKTSGGVNFTCTPNHPILTPKGWIAAAFLNNGDDLLVALNGNAGGLRRNGDIEHIHSCMKALYNTLHRTGLMSRDSTLRIDFHGDIPTSNVEIITKKWLLRNNGDPGVRNSLNKFILKYAYKSFVCFSTFVKHFWRVCKTSFGFVCCRCKTFPFLRRSLSHSNVHRFRPVSGFDIGISQNTINDLTAETETLSKMLDGFTGKIAADKIVNVKVISTGSAATQVYNLQTETGHYFVNSSISQNNKKCNGIYAIAKNCRCTLIAAVDDVDTGSAKRRAIDPKTGKSVVIDDTSYSEWAGWKQDVKSSNGSGIHTIDESASSEQLDLARRVWGKADGQKYRVSASNTVDLYETGRQRQSDGTWVPVRNSLGAYEVPENTNVNKCVVTGLPNKTGFMMYDDTPNYILDSGRIALNPGAKNNNTRDQISGLISNEIDILGGIRKDGHYYRVIGSEKEIEYIKNGTIRKSVNHMTGETEDGLSVWEIPKYQTGKIVEVTGTAISTGSDGEPILDVSTVKFVRTVTDLATLREQGKKRFMELYGWTEKQLEQALFGGYELHR